MESATPNLREQGVQTLREGNLDGAIDLLARAVMADGQDAEAQAFLGVAYSQKGLHAQAKRALESAVALRPQEVRYHFNLGVALEQASDWNGAANAYRHALQINPEYGQARAKLQALSGKIQSAPSVAAPTAEAASGPINPQAPWLAGTSAPGAAPHGGPPGTVQCSQCRQWSKPGLSCEWCSAPLRNERAPATMSGSTYGSSPAGYLESSRGMRADYEDRMDLLQTFTDWVQALISPGRFFSEQAGREGIKAPLGFLLLYTVLSVLLGCIPFFTGRIPLPPGVGVVIMVVAGIISILGMFVWTGIVHGICKMFGGQASYAGSFRAATYASAPLLILQVLSTLVTLTSTPQMPPGFRPPGAMGGPIRAERPHLLLARAVGPSAYPGGMAGRRPLGSPGSSTMRGFPSAPATGSPMGGVSPLSSLILLLMIVVYLIYLGIGVSHIHGLSTGAAVGVALISGVVSIVLFIVCVIIISVGFAALLVGLRGAGR